jgi:hypothetical protein
VAKPARNRGPTALFPETLREFIARTVTALEDAGHDVSDCHKLDLARLVHADRVLMGKVDKASTLIGSRDLSFVNVATGERVFSPVPGCGTATMNVA